MYIYTYIYMYIHTCTYYIYRAKHARLCANSMLSPKIKQIVSVCFALCVSGSECEGDCVHISVDVRQRSLYEVELVFEEGKFGIMYPADNISTHIYTYVCKYVNMYIHIYVHVCLCVCVCARACKYMHVCV